MHESTSTPSWWLAPHVRACECDGQVILLDLLHGQYLGIGGRQLPALAAAIHGWPCPPQAGHPHLAAADIGALTRRLQTKGLLSGHPVERQPAAVLEDAALTLEVEVDARNTGISARHLCRLLHSATATAVWLRLRSLLWIVKTVAARRERLQQRLRCPTPPDEMRNAVAAFDRLRPLAFSARDRCLHDSLTLVGFLAHEGVLAHWVVGVRTQPFAAHSWVQSGSHVLNDLPEHVRRYRPILVV
jgi:hypothetical protein